MRLMWWWWERNIFYNNYYISKGRINIIRTYFGNSVYYGSICWAWFIGLNTYTDPTIGIIDNVTPIKGFVLNNDIHFHYKKYSFNIIPKILSYKINNYITTKDDFDTRIVEPSILKLWREGSYKTLFVCDQYVIIFGTRKNHYILQHF